jgi:SAM-dependent methyltransferase
MSPEVSATTWTRVPITGGELRVRPEARERLERLGLLDPERWRTGTLPGRTVQATPRATILALEDGALFAKHCRGSGAARGRLGRRGAGETERLAAERLAAIGVRAPRFLLVGERRGALGRVQESFLVSERLAGRPLTERAVEARSKRALVELVRALAGHRIHAPDLFAKHVFVADDPAAPVLGLLDLERVEVTRLSAEALLVRHAGNLVATVPGLHAQALAQALEAPMLATRIEERAELVRVRKRLPRDYGARHRYGEVAQVQAYRARSPRRQRDEQRLLDRVLPRDLSGWVLDAPCGAGRFSEELAHRGARPLALDLSPAMVRSAASVAAGAAVGELERLPLADDAVAGVLCFRFLHHVPSPEQRRRVLAELTRVSRRFVVVSFFHPWSAHNALRWVRGHLSRSTRVRHTVTPAELRRDLAGVGWRVTVLAAQAPYRRDLWVLRAEPRA